MQECVVIDTGEVGRKVAENVRQLMSTAQKGELCILRMVRFRARLGRSENGCI